MKAKLTLKCNGCSTTLSFPLVEGSVLPSMDPVCRVCNGILLIDSFSTTQKNHSNFVEVANSDMTSSISSKIITTDKNTSSGGREIFTGFVNRLTPIFVLAQLIVKEQGNDQKVSLESVINSWKNNSQKIREHLQLLEGELKIGRGERLSDGFPTNDLDREGPMQICLRNLLGTDGRYMLEGRGWLQIMGIVERVDANTLRIAEKASLIGEIPDLQTILFDVKPTIIGDHPKLVVFIPKKEAKQLLAVISKLLPDEYSWMMHILEQIKDASELPEGWNSNKYAEIEMNACANGQGHARWDHWNGETLYRHYMETGSKRLMKNKTLKKKFNNPEEFAIDRLIKHINSTLGGLLSRLKEIGLIHPVRIGREKNFKITQFGLETLASQTSEQEVLE